MGESYYSPPRLLNLRAQALEKLSPMSFHVKAMPFDNSKVGQMRIELDGELLKGITQAAPPPVELPRGSAASPPPPPGNIGKPKGVKGAPPPPSVVGVINSKSKSKLKRSTQMGNLYRHLRDKVEGSNCFTSGAKSSSAGRNNPRNGAHSGGGKTMADALSEMTKRSPYFQQIEDDVQKRGKAIKELQNALSAFEHRDMEDLLKFHKHVESQLQVLTDETQVLSRFEGFPLKKLEALRTAASLSTKLNAMVSDIQNWKVDPPLANTLDKLDNYFNKIKVELEKLERTKDEESKMFKSHNIHFDFTIFTKIKESMVDLSSGFIELALKEHKEAKAKSQTSDNKWSKKETSNKEALWAKMLWKTFQFAFKVYSFAGGQDERAETLTRELAKEIDTLPIHG